MTKKKKKPEKLFVPAEKKKIITLTAIHDGKYVESDGIMTHEIEKKLDMQMRKQKEEEKALVKPMPQEYWDKLKREQVEKEEKHARGLSRLWIVVVIVLVFLLFFGLYCRNKPTEVADFLHVGQCKQNSECLSCKDVIRTFLNITEFSGNSTNQSTWGRAK